MKDVTRPVILVADDEPVNRELFSLLLEKLGYNCVVANDGEDAIEKAKTSDPALAFFDILMPKMDGFEAAGNLRSLGYTKPIIVVTATYLPEYDENCKRSGINDVITKPIKLSQIKNILEKWITSKEETFPASTECDPVSKPEVFNSKKMLDAFMNQAETVLPLLSRFIERTGSQLENFPVSKAAGDWTAARRDAHTIKGAAFTMGGAELGEAADALEKACINASAKEAETAYPHVLETFEKFKKEAEEFIRKTR